MINLILKLIVFVFIVYLVLHYVDIYVYLNSSYIPDFLQGFINFAQNTAPMELWGKLISLLPFR
jgi:hypothetical protein